MITGHVQAKAAQVGSAPAQTEIAAEVATVGIANLALAYFYRRDMNAALEYGRKSIEIFPKNVPQRNNVGLYAMYAGQFDAAR